MWEGHDQVLTRPVTVKVLHASLAQDLDRFREESIAAARLSHPNVVATYDTGEEAGTAYVVTELVRGQSLADALAAGGAKPAHEAVDIADQAAAGLEHGHRAGLVHGAVSTSSIFLCDDGLGGTRVKLADFGIAPAGGETGPADDVRALGEVLYEMLSGQPPARTGTDVMRPRKLRAGIPRPLDTLTLRAISGDARQRFRSAFDFRRTLATLDLGPDDAEPFVSPTPTPPAGLPPAARRVTRRTWVPLVVFIALAGLAAGIVTWVLSGNGPVRPASTGDTAAGIEISDVASFDPEANPPTENENRINLLADGNPATGWSTERYRGARFAGLKTGLGVIIHLAGEHRLSRLEVVSPSRGWAARVYVAGGAKSTLADWGAPVKEATGITAGTEIFNLQSTKGSVVLLWITDPGQTNQLEIREVSVKG